MNQAHLTKLATQLSSDSTRERVLALVELQKESMPTEVVLPLIKQAIDDQNVQVRGIAVFSLGIKKSPENVPILTQILSSDEDYNIRAMAAGALGYLEDNRALEALRRAFYEDISWLVQFSAAVALGNLKDIRAKAVLLEALQSDTILLQQAAIMALGEIKAIDTVDRLVTFIEADDWLVRQRLAEALGNLPCEKSKSALRYLQKDSNSQVAEAAKLASQNLASQTIETI